jgi:hypothetical protein
MPRNSFNLDINQLYDVTEPKLKLKMISPSFIITKLRLSIKDGKKGIYR